jgi:hypothetical protein
MTYHRSGNSIIVLFGGVSDNATVHVMVQHVADYFRLLVVTAREQLGLKCHGTYI